MLDELRDTSTLPPRNLTVRGATRVSYAVKAVAAVAVLVAFLAFFLLPSAQPTITKVGSEVLAAPFSCQMLSKIATTVDLSSANVSLPLAPGALPPATLFAFSSYPNALNNVLTSNANTAVGCINPPSSEFAFSLAYNSRYATYSDCVADVTAVSCAVVTNLERQNGGWPFQTVTCAFGKAAPTPLKHSLAWLIYTLSGMNSNTPPACSSTGTTASAASIAAAVGQVFLPSYLCAQFADGANPPYLCTGTERASLISIILQSLSLYATTIGILTATITTCLALRPSRNIASSSVPETKSIGSTSDV